MAKNVPYIYGAADYTILPLTPQGGGDTFQVNPTIAVGDFKIRKPSTSTWENLATPPTVVSATGPSVRIDWSAGEAAYEPFVIWGHDAAGAEWKDIHIYGRMTARGVDDLAQPGAEMDLIDAPNGTAVMAIQSGLSTLEQADILSDATPFAGANIDAAISTRSTLTAAQVWANATRSLTTFGSLIADLWSYAWRTLTSSGTAEEETAGTNLTVTRGVTYDHTLTGLTVPATWAKLYLTAKRSLDDDDEEALVQLMVSNPADAEEDGLLVINAESGTLADGSLTVDDEDGTVRVQLVHDATALVPVTRKATYDLKWLLEDGSSQRPWASASFVVQATETEAIA